MKKEYHTPLRKLSLKKLKSSKLVLLRYQRKFVMQQAELAPETVEEGVSYTTEEAQPEEIEDFQTEAVEVSKKITQKVGMQQEEMAPESVEEGVSYTTEEAQPEEIEEFQTGAVEVSKKITQKVVMQQAELAPETVEEGISYTTEEAQPEEIEEFHCYSLAYLYFASVVITTCSIIGAFARMPLSLLPSCQILLILSMLFSELSQFLLSFHLLCASYSLFGMIV